MLNVPVDTLDNILKHQILNIQKDFDVFVLDVDYLKKYVLKNDDQLINTNQK